MVRLREVKGVSQEVIIPKKPTAKILITELDDERDMSIALFLVILSFFALSIVFSFFVNDWLARTSFGKSFGFNLHRLSFLISLLLFLVLYFLIYLVVRFIIRQFKKKKKN